MPLRKLKQLTEAILEDYLELDKKIVEIGVMTYLLQGGNLSSSKEKMLRKYIEEATGEIKSVIEGWLGDHGLMDLVEELGGSVEDQRDNWKDINSYLAKDILEGLQDNYYSPDEYSEAGLEKIIKKIEDSLGGNNVFGNTLFLDDFLEFLNNHTEQEYTASDEDEEEPPYYLNLSEEDIIDFLIETKRNQVSSDAYFMRLAEQMVESMKEVESLFTYGETRDLVIAFDHLKDLNHHGGSLLQYYANVDWDKVNDEIEDRVKSLTKVKK